MTNEEDVALVDLTSDNQDLKNKMAVILVKLETTSIDELEDQVSILMTNMMNFFAKHVDDIPSFDLLTPEQQKAVLLKFKKVAHSLKTRKIKSIDEMLQTFVFTVLSSLNEKVEQLAADQIINKKSKHGFKSFLKKAASYEIYKITHDQQSTAEQNKDFIHNAVLVGVRKAMHHAGLDIKPATLDKEAFVILEKAHKDFKKLQKEQGISFKK